MKENSSVILSAIFVLCMFLCFIFSIVCYTKFDGSDHMYVASIGKNWSTGPISDVEAGGFDCPPGKVSIINDDWMGTNQGCYCQGIFNTLTATVCNRKSFNCHNVMGVNPIPLKEWRSSNLCGKRGPNYLKLKTASTANGCGGKYKSCGIIDSLNNHLCYPDDIPCPYNFFKIENKDFKVPTDKNYTIVPLGNNGVEGKAIFSNEYKEDKVVNEFRIDDNTPCLSPEYKNLNHQPYVLEKTYGYDKCTNEIGGSYLDKSFTKVDSSTYNQLYYSNKIMSVIQMLPLFATKYNYFETSTSLFYKNYIGMNHRCIENMIKNESAEEFIQGLINVEESINSAKTAALVGMIFTIIGITFTIFLFFMKLCCGGEDSNGMMMGVIILNIILLCIPALVCGSIIVGKINANNFDLTPLAQPGCTDQITQSALHGFTSKISSAKTMAASYLSLSLIGAFVGIFSLILG